jgi:hypothetical protein
MIWLTLYLAGGMLWVAWTFGKAPEVTAIMFERGSPRMLAWMVVSNFLLWPLCIAACSFFKDRMPDRVTDYFRREFIDDERAARALRTQMPAPDPLAGMLNVWWWPATEGDTCHIPDADSYAKAMASGEHLIDLSEAKLCDEPAVVVVHIEHERSPEPFTIAYCKEHIHPVVEGVEGCWHRDESGKRFGIYTRG